MRLQRLRNDISSQDGIQLRAYDDATGEMLRPGYTLQGHPRIGAGHSLDGRGISREDAQALLEEDLRELETQLFRRFPWLDQLGNVRQEAVANLALLLGINELQKRWGDFLGAVHGGRFDEAAAMLASSPLALERPKRVRAIVSAIKSGIHAE